MKIRIKNQSFIDITNHAARCLFIHHNFCNECAGNHGDKKDRLLCRIEQSLWHHFLLHDMCSKRSFISLNPYSLSKFFLVLAIASRHVIRSHYRSQWNRSREWFDGERCVKRKKYARRCTEFKSEYRKDHTIDQIPCEWSQTLTLGRRKVNGLSSTCSNICNILPPSAIHLVRSLAKQTRKFLLILASTFIANVKHVGDSCPALN